MPPISRRNLLAAPLALYAASLAEDPDRPRCHFLPPANWMNDPNAPIWHNGEYHLFYQHNPKAARWDTMHWGHAVSRDLVHWRHLPIALRPTPGGPDKDGCFSGCAVIDGGRPVLVYTGVQPEVQCLATSDDWITWRKHPRNPVIALRPEGLETPGFRDPHVWREDGEWLMALGAGRKGVGGMVLLYSSHDLVEWKYLGPLLEGRLDEKSPSKNAVARGEMWECPDFFPVGDRWLLYVATQGKVRYWLGQWRERKFTPEREGVLAYGPYYAPKSMVASGRRQVIWGWIQETRTREEQLKAGWSGVMSLPVVASLSREGALRLEPAAEVRQLRRGNGAESFGPGPADLRELEVELRAETTLQCGGRTLFAHRPGASEVQLGAVRAPLEPGRRAPLKVRLFLDASVVEAFVENGPYLVARDYGRQGALAWSGVAPAAWRCWNLEPASKNRLTLPAEG